MDSEVAWDGRRRRVGEGGGAIESWWGEEDEEGRAAKSEPLRFNLCLYFFRGDGCRKSLMCVEIDFREAALGSC